MRFCKCHVVDVKCMMPVNDGICIGFKIQCIRQLLIKVS